MLIGIVLLFIVRLCTSYTYTADTTEANAKSQELYDKIMDWRELLGNDPIPLSPSLQYVAQVRVDDSDAISGQYNTYLDAGYFCCPYYSWTGDGPYDGACIDIVFAKAQELTEYEHTISVAPLIYSGQISNVDDCIYWLNYTNRGYTISTSTSIQAIGCAYSENRCDCFYGYYEDTSARDYQCDGKDADDPTVCGGGAGIGACVGDGDCQCWEGQDCLGSDDDSDDGSDDDLLDDGSFSREIVTWFLM